MLGQPGIDKWTMIYFVNFIKELVYKDKEKIMKT